MGKAVSLELLLLMVLKMYNPMMNQILPILLIAGSVVIIFWISNLRERRVQKFSDEFCKAFIEASDHILDIPLNDVKLIYTIATSTGADQREKVTKNPKTVWVNLVPLDEQPQTLQKLLKKGIDQYVLERLHTMYMKRDGAQQYLTSINLIEKKYNSVLNRIYDIANISFSALNDFSVLKTQEDVDNFHFFLYQQDFIRNTTFASIMSRDAKRTNHTNEL